MATLTEQIDRILADFRHTCQAFEHTVDAFADVARRLVQETDRTHIENRILLARLDEARRLARATSAHGEPPTPRSDIPPFTDRTKRCLMTCTCGTFFWSKTLRAQFCASCLSDVASLRAQAIRPHRFGDREDEDTLPTSSEGQPT